MKAAVHEPNSAKAGKSSPATSDYRPVPAHRKPVGTVPTRVTLRALMCFLGSACMPGSRFLLAALLFVFLLPVWATPGEVRIAVAANFAPTLRALAKDFSANTGHRVKISSGSTGKHYAQIRNGAGFDVFLAADAHGRTACETGGYWCPGSRFLRRADGWCCGCRGRRRWMREAIFGDGQSDDWQSRIRGSPPMGRQLARCSSPGSSGIGCGPG